MGGFWILLLSSSVYLITTHQLPSSPPPQTDSPCFQSLFIHLCLTSPCGSCTKCNPSTSCLSLFKFFPQSSLKSFFLALSFHSVSVFSFFPSTLSVPKSLPCFQQRFLQPFSPTIATPFLPFVVASSHCCFCYISLLGSMIHIQ